MHTFSMQPYNMNRFNRDLQVLGIQPLVMDHALGMEAELTSTGFLLMEFLLKDGGSLKFGMKLDPAQAARFAILGNAEWLAGNAETCPFESSLPLSETIASLHERALEEIKQFNAQLQTELAGIYGTQPQSDTHLQQQQEAEAEAAAYYDTPEGQQELVEDGYEYTVQQSCWLYVGVLRNDKITITTNVARRRNEKPYFGFDHEPSKGEAYEAAMEAGTRHPEFAEALEKSFKSYAQIAAEAKS